MNPPQSASDVSAVLAAGKNGSRRLKWLAALVALVVAGLLWLWLAGGRQTQVPRFETTRAERGDLTVTVSATGTLQPTNQVDVGSELSGLVEKVLVDDNSRVKKGQVLAVLDLSRLNDQILNSRAALTAAEAAVAQNAATVKEATAQLARQRDVFKLSGGRTPSQTELDTAEATLARARANLASAQAGVAQARAGLSTNQINLRKASIRSPIDGVVLARKVDPGQTVAASLQAPVLFTLAEDLAQMELQVDVDEADVGQVHEGQAATFSVDAWPGRKYPAHIQRVSFGSQTTNGVVSYPTKLTVANDDLSLRPGMTATAEIVVAHRAGVLLVPNAALRFTPPQTGKEPSRSLVASLMPRPPRTQTAKTAKPVDGRGGRRLWVLRDDTPVAVAVRTGASNGRLTEVVSGGLHAGDAVITGSLAARP